MTAPRRSLELTLRGRLLGLLSALACCAAWLTGDDQARLGAALLLAPLLVDLACKARRLDRLQVRLRPRRTVAGAPFLERLEATNDGPRTVREVLLAEPRTMRDSGGALLERLPPGATVSLELSCRAAARSHVLERVLVAVSAWPFGLWRARAILPVQSELVVEPARLPLGAEVLRAVADRDPAAQQARRVAGDEFHSLRDYRPGEDARSVHARRSAALGTIVCRVTQGRQPSDVGLVLDLRRPPGRALHLGTQRFEHGLSVAASLVDVLRAVDARVRALVLGSRTVSVEIADADATVALLTLLAEAMPSPHRLLEPNALAGLWGCDRVFWVPAGGALPAAAAELGGTELMVLGGGAE